MTAQAVKTVQTDTNTLTKEEVRAIFEQHAGNVEGMLRQLSFSEHSSQDVKGNHQAFVQSIAQTNFSAAFNCVASYFHNLCNIPAYLERREQADIDWVTERTKADTEEGKNTLQEKITEIKENYQKPEYQQRVINTLVDNYVKAIDDLPKIAKNHISRNGESQMDRNIEAIASVIVGSQLSSDNARIFAEEQSHTRQVVTCS